MFTSGFFRGEFFDPEKDIPNLSEKVYVVTGASTGIGYGITAHLLQHDTAKIIVLSNNKEHADAMLDDLKQYGDISRVQWQQCNLCSLKAIDAVAKILTTDLPGLDDRRGSMSCLTRK